MSRPKKPRGLSRKRLPPRRRKRLRVELSDNNRKPFPGYEASSPFGPHYFVTALGRVYRHDGLLVSVDSRLTVRLGWGTERRQGGKRRSLALAVLTAFGHKPPDYYASWRPWIDPAGPLDPLTSRLRCSIVDVRIAPHSEIVRHAMGGPKPTTFYSVL